MVSWTLGNYFPTNETQEVEFKHVPINSNLLEMRYSPCVNEALMNALYTHKDMPETSPGKEDDTPTMLDLLELVKPSFETFLEWVFPKYFTSFCNSGLDGDLYLGIADDGEITGVPHFDELSTDYLNAHLRALCDQYVEVTTPSDPAKHIPLEQLFTVTIIPLSHDIRILKDSIAPIVQHWEQDMLTYNDEMFAYRQAYQAWSFSLHNISGKLINIANTTLLRKDLIQYMANNKQWWTSQTTDLYQELEQLNYYHFNTAFEHFETSKDNPSMIWYWVTKFKEQKVTRLAASKPIKPKLSVHMPLVIAVAKLSDLRRRYVELGVKYNVIKIHFNGQMFGDYDSKVGFRYPHSETIYSKKRIVDMFGEPCTSSA